MNNKKQLDRTTLPDSSKIVKVMKATLMANEGTEEIREDFVIMPNEFRQDGTWVQLAPFGEFPHSGGLQRFQKDDAAAIVNEFRSLKRVPTRMMGLPWYIGHPDHPSFKDQYKDTKAYGRIKELETREDGLWGNVKFSRDGKALVEDQAFHGHSVNWRVTRKGGAWHPIGLKSVGFTNEPNIPVRPVLNANEKANNMEKLQQFVAKLAKVFGMEDGATPEQIESRANELQTTAPIKSHLIGILGIDPNAEIEGALESIANEREEAGKLQLKIEELTGNLTTCGTDRTRANELLETSKTEITELEGKVTGLETALANQREEHGQILLANALREGQIALAEKDKWAEKLQTDFANVAKELTDLPKKVHTTSMVNDGGERGSKTKANQATFEDKMGEREKDFPNETYRERFNHVQENHPELVKDWKQPQHLAN